MAIGRPISLTPNIATKAISSVATANQTDFTVTGGYRINEIAVYRNGVRLAEGRDFTASDGSTVQLVNGATINDVIEFAVFDSFNIADAIVSVASSQTVSGDLNVTGKFYSGSIDPNSLLAGVGTFNTKIHVGTALTANAAGDLETTGIITAASFSGDGSALTGIANTATIVSTATTTGLLNVTGTTDSTSASTGSVTIAGGVGIAKNVFIGAGLSVAGTLTYEDVTSVDSVGLITAKSGVNVSGGQVTIGTGITMGIAGVATFSGTADIHLLDNVKLNVGDGSDLSIYHQGTHSFIEDSGTGSLKIRGSVVELSDTGAAQYLLATEDGAVNIYYNGNKKWETTNSGTIVTGIATATTFHVGDGSATTDRISAGDSNDLYLYHNGTDSYIQNDTGHLIIDSDSLSLRSKTGGEAYLTATVNGATKLRFDNSTKFETIGTGVSVYGPEGGNGQILISADEGDDNADKFGLLVNTSGAFFLQNYSSGSWGNNLKATGGGSLELYHNTVRTFETIGAGISIYGPEGGAGQICLSSDEGDDNADKWRITKESGNNSFRIQNYTSGSWETNILATGNGTVELYNDASKKLETSSSGVTVTGTVAATNYTGDGSALTGVGGEFDITSCLFV